MMYEQVYGKARKGFHRCREWHRLGFDLAVDEGLLLAAGQLRLAAAGQRGLQATEGGNGAPAMV